MSDVARNEQLVRQFFATLSTGDLEALRPLIHREGSWEVMATTVPGAGKTAGGDAVIDDFLKPVRGLFAPGDPKIEVKRTFGAGNLVCAETEADRRAEQRQPLPQPVRVDHRDQATTPCATCASTWTRRTS